jgi:hypothetical protein
MSLLLRRCTLRNAYSYSDGSTVGGEGNVIYASIAGTGFNAANAGVGYIPHAGETWTFVELNQTVTSASFDELLQIPVLDATTQPSMGTWVEGQHVHNVTPSINAGFVALGWVRLTTGSGNAAGTDWMQIVGAVGTVTAYGLTSLLGLGASGASTITATEILASYSIRTGQSAAVTDTLDTATNIIAGITNCTVGTTFKFRSLNEGSYIQTVAAGAGITLNGTASVASGTWREWMGVVTSVSSPAITFTNIGSGSA